jgi:hypothetical protein
MSDRTLRSNVRERRRVPDAAERRRLSEHEVSRIYPTSCSEQESANSEFPNGWSRLPGISLTRPGTVLTRVRIADLSNNSVLCHPYRVAFCHPEPKARDSSGSRNGRQIEGLIEQTRAKCWQCLHEDRGRAGSQQRPQKSEIEGHGGTRVWI